MTKHSNSSSLWQQSDSHPQKQQKQKFEGFDFLRTVFAIAIVALHAQLFSLLEDFKIGPFYVEDILDANVAYFAVPVFFQISLFLFYIKSEKLGPRYLLQKRLPKLISLYLFWVIANIIFNILLTGKTESLRSSTSSLRAFTEFVVSGGNSPLYFFFSLAFITALTEVSILLISKAKRKSLKNTILYVALFASCVLVFVFSVLRLPNPSLQNASGLIKFAVGLAQWNYNPLNFLPYIFTTAIVAQEFNSRKIGFLNSKLKLFVLFWFFLIFSILEWTLSKDLLNYSRLSLVFGSWLLLYLALLSTRKVPATVQFISGCSLGIYTLHLFFTHGFFAGESNILAPLAKSFPALKILIEFFIALSASILLTLLFRRVKFLKGFV
uniref:Acyltransferase 3 domain-containing protein n=1 Tax=Cyanothece sp. (strain PCC 7425 / ATCC 29141) TaxID=395961 RepID=B8HV85_CYAP4